jgi:mannose-6-phosphate isomerase-like protein (cupin superfamily)
MLTSHVIKFKSLLLEQTVAHGGCLPVYWRRVLQKDEGAQCNFLDCTVIPPGAEIGVHTHADDNQEFYIIVRGKGCMYLDGESFEVVAGDVVINRPGGTHGLRNTGQDDMALVVLELPISGPNP